MRHALVRTLTLATLLASALLVLVLAPAPASAQVEPGQSDCSTPRRALATWLGNLQPDRREPRVATACFDWRGTAADPDERARLAEHLKEVLDARGLWVEMEGIPDDAQLPDGEREVRPFPNTLQALRVERVGDAWLISRDTVRAIPRLHQETFAVDVDDVLDLGPAFLRERVLGMMWWQIVGLALFVLLGVLARAVVVGVVAGQGARLLALRRVVIAPVLVHRVASPVGTLAMVLVWVWSLPLLRFGVSINQVLYFGLRVAGAVAAVMIVYRLVDAACDVWARRAATTDTKLDDQAVPLVRKSAKVLTVVFGFIFVLQNMEVDVASLIAGASLGGLAFSLAARDTVANLFGSFSIFADRPFQVGDWVKVEGVEGVVEEVGLRSTRVRTFYRSLVSVPNSKVADAVVDNFGRRDARRDTFRLGVLYSTTSDQLEALCDGIRAILRNNAKVQKNAYEVHVAGFADSAIEILVYYFLEVESWSDELRNRHLIYLEIMRLLESLGIEFAFPTRTLHIASQARPGEAFQPPARSEDELRDAVRSHAPGGARARPAGPKISSGYYAGGGTDKGPEPSPD